MSRSIIGGLQLIDGWSVLITSGDGCMLMPSTIAVYHYGIGIFHFNNYIEGQGINKIPGNMLLF